MRTAAYGVSFEQVPTFSDTSVYLFRGEGGREEIEVELAMGRRGQSPAAYTANLRERLSLVDVDTQIDFEGTDQRGGIEQSLLVFAIEEGDQRDETHVLAASPALDEGEDEASMKRLMITFTYQAQFRSGRWPEGFWAPAVGLSFDGRSDVLSFREDYRRYQIQEAAFYLPAEFQPPSAYSMVGTSGVEIRLSILLEGEPIPDEAARKKQLLGHLHDERWLSETESPVTEVEGGEIRWIGMATRALNEGEEGVEKRAGHALITLGEGGSARRVLLYGVGSVKERDVLRAAMTQLAGSLRLEG